jgi:hypothetical protein
MSTGCGICVSYGGDGGDECVGYRCVIVKAGQPWDCSECGKKILKGERYELASWFYADRADGFGNCKTCLVCAEIADAFMCGGRWHSGSFWGRMEDKFAKLNTACFERLKTAAAKTELQRRWIEWMRSVKP